MAAQERPVLTDERIDVYEDEPTIAYLRHFRGLVAGLRSEEHLGLIDEFFVQLRQDVVQPAQLVFHEAFLIEAGAVPPDTTFIAEFAASGDYAEDMVRPTSTITRLLDISAENGVPLRYAPFIRAMAAGADDFDMARAIIPAAVKQTAVDAFDYCVEMGARLAIVAYMMLADQTVPGPGLYKNPHVLSDKGFSKFVRALASKTKGVARRFIERGAANCLGGVVSGHYGTETFFTALDLFPADTMPEKREQFVTTVFDFTEITTARGRHLMAAVLPYVAVEPIYGKVTRRAALDPVLRGALADYIRWREEAGRAVTTVFETVRVPRETERLVHEFMAIPVEDFMYPAIRPAREAPEDEPDAKRPRRDQE